VRRLAAAVDCGSLLPRRQACALQGDSELRLVRRSRTAF